MKTNQNGFIAGIIIGLVIWGLVAFFIIKAIPQPKQPTYTATDSIARDSLLNRIDTIKVKETIWRTRIKEIKKTDTIYYNGNDTACVEIIARKNRLIAGQDTLIELLDLECREYSELNLIEISRNKTLSDSVSSLHVFYADSLTAQRKTSDKAIKKEKGKTFFYKVTTTVATALGIYGIISK